LLHTHIVDVRNRPSLCPAPPSGGGNNAAFTPDTCSPDTSCIDLYPLPPSTTSILYRRQNCRHGSMYPLASAYRTLLRTCIRATCIDGYKLLVRDTCTYTYFNTAFNERSLLGHLVTARASDSMFLSIDFVRVTNCFYDYDYDCIRLHCIPVTATQLCNRCSTSRGIYIDAGLVQLGVLRAVHGNSHLTAQQRHA